MKFKNISLLLERELEDGTFPGAVLGIVNKNDILFVDSIGYSQLEPEKRKMNREIIFDLASLTKVLATTTAVLKLIEEGRINLWDNIKKYFPESPADKEKITIYHLMTHSSGFRAIVELWGKGFSYDEKIKYILELELEVETGSKVIYSDPNFILLGELIRRVTGVPLDEYVEENIFKPLGMSKTVYNPLNKLYVSKENFAATEWCDWRERMLVGEVHDENAYSCNGVSGHAGLFSNIDDLTVFVRMILNDGEYRGVRILSPQSVRVMRRDWTEKLNNHRGLGWDLINNPYSSGGILFSPHTFGHTGFTGTSIWIDPELEVGVIFLTNRVHPSRENTKIISLRPRLHNLIVATIKDH